MEDHVDGDIHLEFRRFLDKHASSPYHFTHKLRYIQTLQRASNKFQPGMTLLELGGKSILTDFLEMRCGIETEIYTNDLRKPISIPSGTKDLVLMLEVLEHLTDLHSDNASIEEIATFSGSGARNALKEVYRILKPGGYLILTTPNAASVDIIGRVLLKLHPYQYHPHVREYTPKDAMMLFASCGFELEKFDTFFAWNSPPEVNRDKILELIGGLGFDMEHRGDDAFYTLKKS